MKNSNTITSRMFTALTVAALVFALNVSGALAGFWRTLDGITANGVVNPSQFLYGVGQNDSVLGVYGYGYGYGYGDFASGYSVASTGGSGGGGSSSSGGGSSSSSNSSSSSSSSSSNSSSSNSNTTTQATTDTNTAPTTPVVNNSNTSISGTDSADTVRNEGTCTFPGVTPSYTDISGNWAESYIRDLSKRGIMNGVNSSLLDPEGKFEPSRVTTRIEFLKIALRSFCYDYSDLLGNENFSDIADGSWQAKVVELGGALKVINTSNNSFRPNDAISKIEALKMILNIGATRSTNFTLDKNITSTAFNDVPATWMAKYAEKARILGIISGNNGKLDPTVGLSRSQTAKIAVRSMNAQ